MYVVSRIERCLRDVSVPDVPPLSRLQTLLLYRFVCTRGNIRYRIFSCTLNCLRYHVVITCQATGLMWWSNLVRGIEPRYPGHQDECNLIYRDPQVEATAWSTHNDGPNEKLCQYTVNVTGINSTKCPMLPTMAKLFNV